MRDRHFAYMVALTLTVIAIGFSLQSCTQVQPSTRQQVEDWTDRVGYGIDRRTGVCFAVLRSVTCAGYQVVSVTSVPAEACRLAQERP